MRTTECSLIVDFQTHTYLSRNSCSIWARINVKFKCKITTFVSHIFACLLERISSAHRCSKRNRASRDLSFARYDRKLVPFYAIFQGSVPKLVTTEQISTNFGSKRGELLASCRLLFHDCEPVMLPLSIMSNFIQNCWRLSAVAVLSCFLPMNTKRMRPLLGPNYFPKIIAWRIAFYSKLLNT